MYNYDLTVELTYYLIDVVLYTILGIRGAFWYILMGSRRGLLYAIAA